MKKLVKVSTAAVLLLGLGSSVQAEGVNQVEKKGKSAVTAAAQVAPSVIQENKRLITEVAREKGIPAEILKAIADEESDFLQFRADGTPNEAGDGGIGIMQLTLTEEEIQKYNVNVEQLKYDTRYNIEQGANHLLRKWSLRLPTVNNHQKDHIEDWYFALMAYNGLSKRNDPNVSGAEAYQEKLYKSIRANSQLDMVAPTPKIEINYNGDDIISFPAGIDYEWKSETETTQNYRVNDTVYTFRGTSNLRGEVDGAVKAKVNPGTAFEIVGGPYESLNPSNHFVYYKVKGKGSGLEGFMASSNLVTSKPAKNVDIPSFTDVASTYKAAVDYLVREGIANGVSSNTFGTNDRIKRADAAVMIARAIGLDTANAPASSFTDVPARAEGAVNALVAEGIINGKSKTRFAPDDSLTRGEMALILQKAYDLESFSETMKFTDVNKNYKEAVMALVDHKIASGKSKTTFDTASSITRGEFALFIYRASDMPQVIGIE